MSRNCPNCGKVLKIAAEDAGRTVLCEACGQQISVPGRPVATLADAPRAAPPARTTVRPNSTSAATSDGTTDRAAAKRSIPAMLALAAAPILVVLGVAIGWLASRPHASASAEFAADAKRNADLVALKSEAEALAIAGDYADAHEKYRQVSQLAAGRDIKDPLLWDIVERAKADQDRVYAILLARAAAQASTTSTGVADVVPAPLSPQDYPGPFAAKPPIAGLLPSSLAGQHDDLKPTSATRSTSVAAASPTSHPATQSHPSVALAPVLPTRPTASTEPASQPAVAVAPVAAPVMAPAARPDFGARPGVRGGPLIGDADIARAIRSGTDFLLAQFKDDELAADVEPDPMRRYGLHALCAYALLQAGVGSDDHRLDARSPQMKGLIDKLKSYDLTTDPQGAFRPVTYARSLRAAALAVYSRPEDRKALKADVEWLVAAQSQGAYTYDDRFNKPAGPPNGARPGADAGHVAPFSPEALADLISRETDSSGGDDARSATVLADLQRDPRTGQLYEEPKGGPLRPPPPIESDNQRERWRRFEFPWDNSNSQYGLLGVWAGAEAGIEVPTGYWRAVQGHWNGCQFNDGRWPYRAGDKDGSLAMACAGVASLLVTNDYLDAAASASSVGRTPYSRQLMAGLTWLDKGNNSVDVTSPATHYIGYDMYGVERAGLASGFKYFGGHDWYLELAEKAIASQRPNGSWGASDDGQNALIDTSYVLLFLARGRHPVMMNKLRFDGYWINRPRDLANLTRYAGRQLERPVNWQVVGLDVMPADWLDSPILYIASHKPPNFTDADYGKLRSFVEQGGLIFTHADAGADAFNKWIPELVRKVTPAYEMQPVPDGHDLYTINYKLKGATTRLFAVGNGSRFLIVHSPTDLSALWQGRNEKVRPDAYQIAVNLFLYASGRVELRNRLASPAIAEPTARPTDRIRVARVRYAGNWDPEPGAWSRFGRYFQWETGLAAQPEVVSWIDLRSSSIPFAHLTGTGAFSPSDDEIFAIRRYVEQGGVLLIDACGGSAGFASSIERDVLPRAFPMAPSADLRADHPKFKFLTSGGAAGGGGNADYLARPKLRAFASERLGKATPFPRVTEFGKGCVVYSRLDLSTALVGANTWGVFGYQTDYASALVRDLLVWTRTNLGAK